MTGDDEKARAAGRRAPRLVGVTGPLRGEAVVLSKPRTVIGRDPAQCDVVLEPPVISRRHAAVDVDAAGRAFVTDLGSSGGTYVNGEQVAAAPRELREGDRLGLGAASAVSFTYHAASLPAEAGLGGGARADDEPVKRAAPPEGGAGAGFLRVGRAPDNDIVLDYPAVSRYHARIDYAPGRPPVLTDLGSTNGTYVNGEPLAAPRPVSPTDLIYLGGFVLNVDGQRVTRRNLAESHITALQITKEVPGKTLLHDISLACHPREFVGLMGPSGCGKSTLMDALNGFRPATRGTVLMGDLDLYRNFDALRRSIGYVPQRDILHDALTVERTLHFAARLRLPEGTPAEQIRRVVDEVIESVGLAEQRRTQFRQLSGGQQKRLSLAVELITKPSFLFLDEPTSPLDPETTENMMMLFRRLADDGRIVVMVTHRFEKFEEMHQVAILTRGGRLAFYGPPAEALGYFGCTTPGDIYRRLSARDPEELGREFAASAQYERYVGARLAEARGVGGGGGPLRAPAAHPGDTGRQPGLSQWLTLTRRYLEIKLGDRRNTLLLLMQAVVIALLLAATVRDPNDPKTLFFSSIIAIWFGANNAIREIVSEAAIYARERLVNLKIPSYVLSKFAILSGVSLIQCLVFVGLLVGFERLRAADFAVLLLVFYLTSLAGIAMGLFFSAVVKSSEKAMTVLPLILIPQLLLGGLFKPLEDFHVYACTGQPAAASQYVASQGAPAAAAAAPCPNPVRKYEGLGAARWAAALMIGRWSFEALAHAVSREDAATRHLLAASTYVAQYSHVLDGDTDEEVSAAYRRRVLLDLLVLSAFCLVLLALTMAALKRKDVL